MCKICAVISKEPFIVFCKIFSEKRKKTILRGFILNSMETCNKPLILNLLMHQIYVTTIIKTKPRVIMLLMFHTLFTGFITQDILPGVGQNI